MLYAGKSQAVYWHIVNDHSGTLAPPAAHVLLPLESCSEPHRHLTQQEGYQQSLDSPYHIQVDLHDH